MDNEIKELIKNVRQLNKENKHLDVVNILTEEKLNSYQNLDLFKEIAIAHNSLIDYAKSDYYLEKARQLYPNSIGLLLIAGNIYSKRNDYEKAIHIFEKVIDIDSRLNLPYLGIGNAYSKLKNLKKAEEYYIKAIEYDPKFPLTYASLAVLYNKFDLKDKAIKQFEKSLEIDPQFDFSLFYLAEALLRENNLKQALYYYKELINIANEKETLYKDLAKLKIEEIHKRIKNEYFNKISHVISQIKNTLLFKDSYVTHYTGIGVGKALILDNSKFRLSEGSYLNDTSEGREIFNYLKFKVSDETTSDVNIEMYIKKPFIGSFVAEIKHNNLTLWRMYGKDNKDEAKGCAITLNKDLFIQSIKDLLQPDEEISMILDENLNFYRVAYLDGVKFFLPHAKPNEQKRLNKLMGDLLSITNDFNKNSPNKTPEDEKDVLTAINEIAYLFKSVEYQHEIEVRLVVKGIGFIKEIDTKFYPPRIYLNTIPINPLIKKITIGPKVNHPDEWAAAFHYKLEKEGLVSEINISHLPFK